MMNRVSILFADNSFIVSTLLLSTTWQSRAKVMFEASGRIAVGFKENIFIYQFVLSGKSRFFWLIRPLNELIEHQKRD